MLFQNTAPCFLTFCGNDQSPLLVKICNQAIQLAIYLLLLLCGFGVIEVAEIVEVVISILLVAIKLYIVM